VRWPTYDMPWGITAISGPYVAIRSNEHSSRRPLSAERAGNTALLHGLSST
jgi:hypothetical protein